MVVMKAFFKLVRWPNLLIIAGVQYLIRFAIVESLNVPHVLNHLEFFLGVLCSISLAAAGYIVNDLHDQPADRQNKPERMVIGPLFSENKAWSIYGVLNMVAVITGFYLSQVVGFSNLWLIPVVAIALLYLYAIDLKRRPILGNLVVSLLVGLPVLLTGVFDVLPAAGTERDALVKSVFQVILAYTAFAVYTNFIREIIKDAEDIEGDRKQAYRTLAVILGGDNIRYVILSLLFVLLIFTGTYNLFLFNSHADIYSSLYLLIMINLPILYLAWVLINAREKKDYRRASLTLKLIMISGMMSMLVFTLSVKAAV